MGSYTPRLYSGVKCLAQGTTAVMIRVGQVGAFTIATQISFWLGDQNQIKLPLISSQPMKTSSGVSGIRSISPAPMIYEEVRHLRRLLVTSKFVLFFLPLAAVRQRSCDMVLTLIMGGAFVEQVCLTKWMATHEAAKVTQPDVARSQCSRLTVLPLHPCTRWGVQMF